MGIQDGQDESWEWMGRIRIGESMGFEMILRGIESLLTSLCILIVVGFSEENVEAPLATVFMDSGFRSYGTAPE